MVFKRNLQLLLFYSSYPGHFKKGTIKTLLQYLSYVMRAILQKPDSTCAYLLLITISLFIFTDVFMLLKEK